MNFINFIYNKIYELQIIKKKKKKKTITTNYTYI